MNGGLSGLVAITGGCGVVEPWSATIIGFVGGILYLLGSRGLVMLRLDDAVDAIPVHMVNGIWGMIAVGLFGSPELLRKVCGDGAERYAGLFMTGDGTLLACQLVGLLCIIGWVMLIMLPFFVWLDYRGWFRSDPLEEIVGLDTSYHGRLPLDGDIHAAGEGEHINQVHLNEYRRRRQETLRNRRRANENNNSISSSAGNAEGSEHGNEVRVPTPILNSRTE